MRVFWVPLMLFSLSAMAGTAPQPPDGVLQTPKYESLRFTRIKMHAGPGQQYPVTWIYQRKGMPIKVVATYDVWRKVVDADGVTGWVQETMISDKRTILVTAPQRSLKRDAADTAETVAMADPGSIAQVRECRTGWCHVKFADYEGWMKQGEVWGTASGESFGEK